MKLTPHEMEKINLHTMGTIAQRRLASGIRLNVPETIALIVSRVMDMARQGNYSVAQLMELGRSLLGKRQVMAGVAAVVDEVQIETTFRDGTKLVTVHNPIARVDGDLALALHGSFLPVPSLDKFVGTPQEEESNENLIPGEVIAMDGSILLNRGRDTCVVEVTNTSDRPVQIGSHYHFIEANPVLVFDRLASYGKRLNIAAGTAIRFEPGESKTVTLVDISGNMIVRGGNNICNGPVDKSPENMSIIAGRIRAEKFGNQETSTEPSLKKVKRNPLTAEIPRALYARMYGPTTGDIVRLADSDLYIRVEKDFTSYGDECKFGGGKVLREGMGQATGLPTSNQLDTVIMNALIVDYTGIYKADVGIKDGRISGIGKAGNPDVMQGVSPGMITGVNTESIACEGLILTAGGMDSHIHFICPQICDEAIASGLTTLLGGGTGPASGTCATTCTPGPVHLKTMLLATDNYPMNFGFTGKGNTSAPEGLVEIVEAGAVGLKLHEDWGTTPAAIDNCLSVAEREDVQVTIHTDTLNESSCVERTVATFKGRTIHTYHTEGAGGGHAPDIISVCSESNVIPSSTNPTRPLTVNTIDEHLDMLMVCHHLDSSIPEDVAFAESRIRLETIAAEDRLQDLGAISIVSSDSQAMGRVGEVITRTWQTAHKMKVQFGQLPEDIVTEKEFLPPPRGIKVDNFRVRRYVAKYTINPCVAHGISHEVGSIEVGKLADLVLWKPAFFGVKPEMVIKCGQIAWSQMGDPNASIPTPQPVYMRPMFAAMGQAAAASSVAFVSQRCVTSGTAASYGLKKRILPIKNCRKIGKKDMKLNDYTPKISVNPETYAVVADGVHLTCKPASVIPMSQLYMSF